MRLSSMLSDGMVLQRNARVMIWGTAESGRKVQVSFLGQEYGTTADSNGDWRVALEKLQPGGPYEMTISMEHQESIVQSVIRDILIGDVWVLGGQSNMELPVRRTLDVLAEEVANVNLPFIRQFAVPQTYNFHGPQHELPRAEHRDAAQGEGWITATPRNVLDFSAVGFFFAKALYEKYQVPIGLIHAAVGGTPIEAWISEPTLRAIGGYEAVLEQCKDDHYVSETKLRDEERNQLWYEQLNDNDLGLKEGWFRVLCDTSGWEDIQVPGSWSGSKLASVRGAVWLRREFDVPVSMLEGGVRNNGMRNSEMLNDQMRNGELLNVEMLHDEIRNRELMLKLGTVVDADDTYINGVCIGKTGYMYPPRRYPLPEGLLQPGRNMLTVRVISTQNTGGFVKDMPYKIVAGSRELDLRGAWKYRIGAVTEALESQTFFQYMPSGVYNSMIAPLRDYPIKGILWYQGESNTGQPAGYSELFARLVQDWRRNWGSDEIPFIYAQLANLGEEDDSQVNWAELREEQRKGLTVPNTAMAVTIDVGEYNDLHPQDKKTVGQRLALCARKLAYGEEQLVYSGPMFKSMERIGGANAADVTTAEDASTIVVHFDHIGSGLTTRDGGELQGFAVCGPDGRFFPANAVISGDTVIVKHDEIRQPVHVRYAWSNNPARANLYNREGLPASPFSTL
ncbi:sialate O-acetylesterase [Paenibacillus lentus]|uniref:Sialate O-acetylesterase n=1 Tax=Paenibacillus lentus TaxID=1338368 RepID=A0A3S8RQT1_9BACL|nr:sialate O-acetylesterase [Paenibacillus lentus]AZK45314.1 sialate O-acetylesterase [Paenibacillus lentus]